MKVIDFRFRPNTPEIIDGIKNSAMFKAACKAIGFDASKPQSLEEIIADLDARNVELAVITGRDCETTYGSPANNPSVLSFCKAFPEKFAGFWGIDPHKKMAAVREIEYAIQELGMKGIAIDPYLAHIPASEARFYPIYTKCAELDVPVFVTMAPPPQVPGAIMDYADPRDIDRVARDFPELTLIMSHGGYPFVNESIFACMRNANVYMDFSEYEEAPMANVFIEAMATTISDKVLFASAHPFIELSHALAVYESFPLTDEVRAKVMYENAKKVLKLEIKN
ncbi:hypothetical protein LZ24_01413 [Desulfobotulus alkaliphilus]|uniref:Amidohydrolase-related domain-containing protein n=1 Tax=Desulfobotulus alkaliphilus TaxID=622671 RepID=A0A562RVD4_9BACT|nr:amidohydrolase family protein [Desulfobotulus alkaliphilus]TWI73002.1 hypothetical protein LZ24_01413 [Desulfobotulus alkaliphilus]